MKTLHLREAGFDCEGEMGITEEGEKAVQKMKKEQHNNNRKYPNLTSSNFQ